MNKKLLFLILLVGVVLGSYRGYVQAEGSPCKITVAVYSLTNAYDSFNSSYDGDYTYDERGGVLLNSDAVFAASLTGSGDCSTANVLMAINKWCTYDKKNEAYKLNTDKTKIGNYTFNWRASDVTATGNQVKNVTSGQSYSISNATYFFTFPDNKDVELVITAPNGSITGSIGWDASGSSENGYWKSKSWYKANDKTNIENNTSGLSILQDSTSGKLQIKSTGEAKDATITIYVSSTPLDIKLQDGVFSGTVPTPNSSSTGYEASGATTNGYADSYIVGNGYEDNAVSDNTWTQIETLVNNFIDEIKMVSWFYYGIAFLSSILMIIINIVKTAGAPNNPMMKTKLYINLGVSFLCLALLGASVILTRLFILTCLG